jgi:hypothetical protein
METYTWGSQKRKLIGNKAQKYVHKNFSYNKMIRKWNESIEITLSTWKENYTRTRIEEIK